MGLWLWEDVPPMTFSLADEATQIRAALVRAGAWGDEPATAGSGHGDDCREPCAEVVDLAAVRAARECR